MISLDFEVAFDLGILALLGEYAKSLRQYKAHSTLTDLTPLFRH